MKWVISHTRGDRVSFYGGEDGLARFDTPEEASRFVEINNLVGCDIIYEEEQKRKFGYAGDLLDILVIINS